MGEIKITFKSKMKKDKNLKKENEIVNYEPEKETYLDVWVEANKYFIPMMKIKEDSNVAYIGYCNETQSLVVQYKEMKYSVEGFELGLQPEPFGYWYHDVHKLVFNNLVESNSKVDFINTYIKENYMYHREAIGVTLPLMMDEKIKVA